MSLALSPPGRPSPKAGTRAEASIEPARRRAEKAAYHVAWWSRSELGGAGMRVEACHGQLVSYEDTTTQEGTNKTRNYDGNRDDYVCGEMLEMLF